MATHKRIGLRDIQALGAGQEIWDSAVPGFGARRQRSTAVAYVVLYRTHEGRQRRLTIGRHGAPWTPDSARTEAKSVLGRVARGIDPAAEKLAKRKAETVGELLDQYWTDVTSGRLLTRRKIPKKDSTLLSDRGRIEKHIRPLLGKMKVIAVTSDDIERFMHAVASGETAGRTKTGRKRGLSNVRGGQGVASRTVGLLGAIFTYAVRHRMRGDNPVRGVIRPADGRRERRLSNDEYATFGLALLRAEQEGFWPAAIHAARFLALTGWRSGEALGLRWAEVDVARRTVILSDSKTGRSIRPLAQAACDLLCKLDTGDRAELVFPASRGIGHMTGFPKIWARMIAKAGLPAEITPHVMRHSFASLASDLGYSEPSIAALIGHKGHTVTSRYVHSADAVLLAAADTVSARIAELMTYESP